MTASQVPMLRWRWTDRCLRHTCSTAGTSSSPPACILWYAPASTRGSRSLRNIRGLNINMSIFDPPFCPAVLRQCAATTNVHTVVLPAQFTGKDSVDSYLLALDRCFERLSARHEAVHGQPFSLADIDFCVFHAPFNKMARKAAARLYQLESAR